PALDELGGGGGVPLEGEGKQERRRKGHADRRADTADTDRRADTAPAERRDDRTTPAADTDEASRLDRPQGPGEPGGKAGRKGTRWVGPRDE
ncbi:hypothetical protein ABZY57_32785, partial [Streptomyces sp. NPDC006450]|uniref:hypothetical protein n=1 Tax=Streptomyces sp. NPDC006450 TaxID=3155458 RepID=UPI0033BC9E2D